jgi:hypothetical protein
VYVRTCAQTLSPDQSRSLLPVFISPCSLHDKLWTRSASSHFPQPALLQRIEHIVHNDGGAYYLYILPPCLLSHCGANAAAIAAFCAPTFLAPVQCHRQRAAGRMKKNHCWKLVVLSAAHAQACGAAHLLLLDGVSSQQLKFVLTACLSFLSCIIHR